MQLQHLYIRNFKGIQELDIDFKPGFNLLIGDNGSGKTSVLEAASVALGGYLMGIEDVPTRNILKSDIRYSYERDYSSVPTKIYHLGTLVGCDFLFENRYYRWARERVTADSYSRTTISDRSIINDVKLFINSFQNDEWPVLSYHSAARHFLSSRSDARQKSRELMHDRRCGYLGCFDRSLNMQAINEWCSQMEWYRAVNGGEIPTNYKAFLNIISKFMQIMDEGREARLVFSMIEKKLVYEENSSLKDLSDLSDGYKSIVSLITELAYRMAILNPKMGDDISCARGIVLIDEIDTNLHAKWQWKIIQALTEIFPNVQFIAATHSPIILASCKNANIIDLSDLKNVKYYSDYYSYPVSDILGSVLGHHIFPGEVEGVIRSFDAAMDAEKYDNAKAALNSLRDLLGENHIEYINRLSEYKIETMEE